jgi:hypothetical protein
MQKLRSVIQDREASQDVTSASSSFRLVDEAMQALEWALARKPDGGLHRRGRYWIYNQRGIKSLKIPEITVLYSFTDDEVTLHAITLRDAS